MVTDLGGDCPGGKYEHGICSGECPDRDNLAAFFQELRAASPNMQLSIAATASPYAVAVAYDIPTMDGALDHWNLMDYDYFVSDIDSANVTMPNSLLHALDLPGFD